MPKATSAHDDKALPVVNLGDERTRASTAAIRLVAVGVFLGIGSVWTYERKMGAGVLVWPLLVYLALTTLVFVSRRRALTTRLSWVLPFLDIALAFLVHWQGISADPAHPLFSAAWGVSGLGVYTLIVALSGLSMPVRSVVALTILSAAAEVILLRTAGLSYWPAMMAVFALGFVAVSTSAVPRQAAVALEQERQTTTALTSIAQLEQQNKQLELLQREKDALLEIIVHDMRSPIGGALLSLEYLTLELKKHPSQAHLLEATDDALSTLNSLGGMISQILDMSKLESGRLTLRLDLTTLRPVLAAAVQATAPRALSRSIAVDFSAPEDLRAALDLRIFPRVLEVLTTYFIRCTPERGRILLVASSGADEVRVSIDGTAPAISSAERLHLFDKFPPLTTNEPRRASAAGVGLYFCRLVAAAHQGTISVEDVDGWPMSIVIHLPVQHT